MSNKSSIIPGNLVTDRSHIMISQALPDQSPAALLGRMLRLRGLSCATAESCTGGMIGAAITAVTGSSEWYRGGVIAYSNEVKTALLQISPTVLSTCGAVSAETVSAMAAGAAELLHADCSVSVSGIAGPGGGSDDKPVGLVYFGTCLFGKTAAHRSRFPGDRAAVRCAATKEALRLLIDLVETVV